MTIFDRFANLFKPRNEIPPAPFENLSVDVGYLRSNQSKSGKNVTPESSKSVATAYRCGNIISDDIASMPFQMFERNGKDINRVTPDGILRNMAYLLEIQPNRWMTPFILKKTATMWLIHWGNAYLWMPPSSYREIFLLRSDSTYPVFDKEGNLWYQTVFPSGKKMLIPAVEITHLMINSVDGFIGRSVLSYARDTLGRQMAAYETQNKLIGNGLNPAGTLQVNGVIKDPAARKKLKLEFLENLKIDVEDEGKVGIALLDDQFKEFNPITMKPIDVQFLQIIGATDAEIANFFGMPLYMLNQGKQSYESNMQQYRNYLYSTLDSYLVQFEQAGRLKWLPQVEQSFRYFRFIRESLMRTDPKTRAEFKQSMIITGQMSPNEARQIEDLSPYLGGDSHYIAGNMGKIQEDGSILVGSNPNKSPTK